MCRLTVSALSIGARRCTRGASAHAQDHLLPLVSLALRLAWWDLRGLRSGGGCCIPCCHRLCLHLVCSSRCVSVATYGSLSALHTLSLVVVVVVFVAPSREADHRILHPTQQRLRVAATAEAKQR